METPTDPAPLPYDGRQVFDAIQSPLLILDRRLQLKDANRSFYQVFGETPASAIDKPLQQLGNGYVDMAGLVAHAGAALQNGERSPDQEWKHALSTTGARTVEVSFRSLPPADGGDGDILMSVVDITEGKRQEESQNLAREFADNIVDTIRQPLLILDASLTVIRANRFFYTTFKVAEHEVLNQSLSSLGNGQWNIPEMLEVLQRILATGETLEEFEVEHDFASLGRRVMLLNARKLYRPGNNTGNLFVSIEDITERREREQYAAAAREFAENIVSTVREPLLVLDDNLEVLSANRFFYHTFKVEPGATLGFHISRLGNAQWNIPSLLEKLDETLSEKRSFEDFEVEHEFESIGKKVMLLNGRKMFRPGNNTNTILLAIEDVTARIEAEKVIEESNRMLKEKNDEMEQFVYVVSHDLKSPLVTLNGFLGMLKKQLSAGRTDKVDHYLKRLDVAVKRMGTLIEDLLNLSRIGKARGELVPLSLSKMAADAANNVRETARVKGAKIRIEENMPVVLADAHRLGEVLQNLLENALKYGCPEPGGLIEVGAERREHEVCLYVRDFGPGIAPQYHQKIFRLFERLDSASEGTGVGLAVVARVAQSHEGRAWVESGPGEGAAFYFALPINYLYSESEA